MLCAKAPRTLQGKDNCCASSSNCCGKIFHLSEADSQRFGFKTKVCLCLTHYEEKTPANSACCFPKRSDSDKCSGCLVICPQRLVTVFETISPPKTSSRKICHGHLKTANNDDRIIGNKYYSSARKRQHSQSEAKVPPTDTRDWGELLKKLEALEQENKHLKENNPQ
ncbi:PREDICTED: uncharacterized protein LOC107351283 [Acropora digitifera]|uniref:uncharacterized protein LOC107351283 n=1 Tax=Acropora digitifera TaxID=70779 RepID=UPI000779FF24|nr:PREDICTED: uncharacterized protein LOC107351283 [Acropora digitifera]